MFELPGEQKHRIVSAVVEVTRADGMRYRFTPNCDHEVSVQVEQNFVLDDGVSRFGIDRDARHKPLVTWAKIELEMVRGVDASWDSHVLEYTVTKFDGAEAVRTEADAIATLRRFVSDAVRYGFGIAAWQVAAILDGATDVVGWEKG